MRGKVFILDANNQQQNTKICKSKQNIFFYAKVQWVSQRYEGLILSSTLEPGVRLSVRCTK